MGTVFVLNQDQMGSGDEALGRKILGSCLRKLAYFDDLDAVLFYNAGVRLLSKNSPVSVELGLLKEKGVDLLPCQTCVDHFELRGELLTERLSNMDEILATMRSATKVITL